LKGSTKQNRKETPRNSISTIRRGTYCQKATFEYWPVTHARAGLQ